MNPLKMLLLAMELINCYAVVYYSNFLFFYMRNRFGFGELQNLLLAALGGLVYVVAAWQGGAFAQRYGGMRSLVLGFGGMVLSLVGGLFLDTALAQVIVYAFWAASVCFTWPALEALICEGPRSSLPNMVGLYNVGWAAGGSMAFFTTGMLLEKLGVRSLFWFPALLHLLLLALVPVGVRLSKRSDCRPDTGPATPPVAQPGQRRFMQMAWLANPLSYVAINTLVPLIPSVTGRLGLTTAHAGIVCSAWMFARLFAFVGLWQWTGWHYRFRWLAGSYVLMIVCFAGMLLSPSIVLLVAAQIGFGLSVGLIYYSSLFYSMDASEEKGAHGGFHEAMIGTGLFVGPAVGAASLALIPSLRGAGALSVSGLLVVGFTGLLALRPRRRLKGGSMSVDAR